MWEDAFKQWMNDIGVDSNKLTFHDIEKEELAHYSKKTIDRLKEAEHTLRQAADMAQRADWLLSGDDGEDEFHERWQEEVRGYWKHK